MWMWFDAWVTPGKYRLITPDIDTSGYSDLHLTFKHYTIGHDIDGYTMSLEVSKDGGLTWDSYWSVAPTDVIGSWDAPDIVSIDLSDYDGETLRIAWVFDCSGLIVDDPLDFWGIDDIVLTGIPE
ncbi:MAG: hypothetical protein D5S00_05655 [Tindallia sp. MSAO_Bac2]|nr:MAG: hypothetical protein D5S00_05655 [Tindallia sp. MSAO_Bac2]